MPHVRQMDAVPGRTRAWECEEAAGSEASDVQCQRKAVVYQFVGAVVETYYPSDEEERRWAGHDVKTDQLHPRIQKIHPSRSCREVVASPLRENLGEGGGYKTSHPLHHRCRVSPPGKECLPE